MYQRQYLVTETEDVPTETISQVEQTITQAQETVSHISSSENRFYSPLVKKYS
jgi:hypothetical protein